jgi:hypothetical protein
MDCNSTEVQNTAGQSTVDASSHAQLLASCFTGSLSDDTLPSERHNMARNMSLSGCEQAISVTHYP